MENVWCQFGIEIATGDPIIPSEKTFEYKCLITGQTLKLKAYSFETIVSEKLETILQRGMLNSRSKDYYDLYVLWGLHSSFLTKELLSLALKETCRYRKFEIDQNEALELLEQIKNNDQINKRWITYCNTVGYAKDLEFDKVVETIKHLTTFILANIFLN